MDPVLDLKTGQNRRWTWLAECGPLCTRSRLTHAVHSVIPRGRIQQAYHTHTHTHTHTRTHARLMDSVAVLVETENECHQLGTGRRRSVVVGGSQRNPAHGRRGHLLIRFVRLCLFSPS
ncbi:hypothetical protein LX32DRAFT_156352 [Colletotrichum zoysiae]|uniref:Uncharacterized protein n=1 Tax=Colletotrichum zoysiae TaxID=1216348 RepID=A0AAD9M3D8_9PEZI|nr:hypothetical protein LX32DRAFT_156352 [Colletotrichum zoysiae]